MSKDFRYTMPDGSEVEAFQVTDAGLFQDSESPDWMNSKMLFTKSSKDTAKMGATTHWLKVDEVETPIPKYGWIIRRASGAIEAVDYTVMEEAIKLVREVLRIPDIARPSPEGAIRLAAKMNNQPFDEVKEEDRIAVETANANRQAMIDSMHPDDAAAGGYEQTPIEPELPLLTKVVSLPDGAGTNNAGERDGTTYAEHPGLLNEMRKAFDLMRFNDDDAAFEHLREVLCERASWCGCAPGACDGSKDIWDCRKNSPLIDLRRKPSE